MIRKLIFICAFLFTVVSFECFSENNNTINVSEQKADSLIEGMYGEGSDDDMSKEKNYQDRVLSNPETNPAARIGVKQSGGNTAAIRQNGSRNSSDIIQSGDENMATQIQLGADNLLYLKQKGCNNRHVETQTGKNNRKVIIQNDSETFLKQVAPKDVK